jgi:hypothetical protein
MSSRGKNKKYYQKTIILFVMQSQKYTLFLKKRQEVKLKLILLKRLLLGVLHYFVGKDRES